MGERNSRLTAYIWTTSRILIRPDVGDVLPTSDPPAIESSWVAARPTHLNLNPLTFWSGPQALSSHRYAKEVASALLQSPVFEHPLDVVLIASTEPGREQNLLRIGISLVASIRAQFVDLLRIDRESGGALPLIDAAQGRMGLDIGRRWVPAPPNILAPHEFGDDAALDEFARFCDEQFALILCPDPSATSAALLESIPGIGGEAGM